MPIAPTIATPLPFSLPVVAYYAEFTGCTVNDTKNTCVIGGLPVGFTPNGALVWCITNSASAATPQASYATYDLDTFAIDGSDPTKCNIDVYVVDTTTGGATIVAVLIW
jgi:hypothetical protein